jgi:hypothetical protein
MRSAKSTPSSAREVSSARYIAASSTTKPMKNTPYRERLALFSNGIAVIIHDAFIDKKKIDDDFKSVNPQVAIFT